MTESVFAGIDLHSNNVMIGIVDQSGQRLKFQKLECDLQKLLGSGSNGPSTFVRSAAAGSE